MLFCVLASTARAQNPPAPPNQASGAHVLQVTLHADGAEVTFTALPGQLLGVVVSNSGADYQFAGIAAEIAPGVYVYHDPDARSHRSRLYVLVTREQNWPNYGPEVVNGLMSRVPYVDDLKPHERAALQDATQNLVDAANRLNDLRRQLIDCERQEADCLKLVAAAQAAMQAAEAAAQAAANALTKATNNLANLNNSLPGLETDLAAAKARRDRWFHEFNVFLDWAAEFEAAGDGFHATQMRENAANAQKNYEAWQDTVDDLEQDSADTEAAVAAADRAKGAAEADKAAKDAAAAAAREAYERVKRDCDPCRAYAQQMRGNVKDAEAEKDRAAQERADAERSAAAQAAQNRADAATAAGSGNGGDAGPPAPAGPNPTQIGDLSEVAKFLAWIKEHGGEELYEDALKSIFGTALDTGVMTLEALKAGIESLARNGTALTMEAASGATRAILQAAYGFLAQWVKAVATEAVVKLASRTIAGLAVLNVPKKGDIKFVPNPRTGTAELYIRNQDGSVTIYTFRRSTGLRVGSFKNIP
ncbi:MAG: hypothetical protein GY872_12180 [Roseibacillus sp.]|nr:hypothetical protein [Roseibacillus sp.]